MTTTLTLSDTAGQCVSHFVKTSVLEAVILQAIQAVSKYALENEAEFVAQLKSINSTMGDDDYEIDED